MPNPLAEATSIYQSANKKFESGDIDSCGDLLSKLKISLIQCSTFLPESGSEPKKAEHGLTRSFLELGVLYSIKKKDLASFERYIFQLKPYYLDFNADIQKSAYTEQMLGLYLLYLLAKNQVAEFHMELERLPSSMLDESHYLQHPVKLEQSLMEGNYRKVFLARDNIPAAEYKFFMDELVSTIRSEIADCIESSFTKQALPLSEVSRLLYFKDSDRDALNTFLRARMNWVVDNNMVTAESRNVNSSERKTVVDSNETTAAMVDYAKALEVII